MEKKENFNWINRPVFIVGHPKSGTSLLNSMLDSHPELMVLPEESDFYNIVWKIGNKLNYQWRLSKNEKFRNLLNEITKVSHTKNYFRGKVVNDISGNLDYENISQIPFENSIKDELKSSKKFLRKSVFESIVKSYYLNIYRKKDHLNLRYWVEKTPKHLWHLNEILADFPNSKFIYIYRDPRDNYVSYKKKKKEKLNSLKFSKNWNTCFDLIENVNKNNVTKIRYEDLIESTERTMNNVSNFLNIETSKDLLKPTKNGKTWKGNSMFGDQSNNIRNTSMGRYKDIISTLDLKIIESFCYDNLINLGYKINYNSKSLNEVERKYSKSYNAIIIEPSFKTKIIRFLVIVKKIIYGK